MMPYQAIRVKGQVVSAGERTCDDRFELIRPVLDQYKRPFTVLDLGANTGYFGQRIAEEYPAVSVCIDADPVLIHTLEKNGHGAVIGLRRELSVQDLKDLAACEHFDVVLALNVLHHFEDWRGAFDAVCQLGEQTIFETPPPADVKACGQARVVGLYDAIEATGALGLGTSESHTTPGVFRTLSVLTRPKTSLTEPYLWSDLMGAERMRHHSIISTASSKSFTMLDKNEHRTWFPGLNAWTYAQMGGAYPNLNAVKTAVEGAYLSAVLGTGPDDHFVRLAHGDVRPWNFILHGTSATLIDWNDPKNLPAEDALTIKQTMEALGDPKSMWAYQERKLNRWGKK